MTLLSLERVSRHHLAGGQARRVLHEVCLEMDAGELVAVWGPRRCGRSTLLRIAAGLEPPDAGVVRVQGRIVVGDGPRLPGGVAYCHPSLHGGESRTVAEELSIAQLARGAKRRSAAARAAGALARVGAERCARRAMRDLYPGEAVRVALARALALDARLLLVDDPIRAVGYGERDELLALLRSLADEGLGVLACTDDATGLAGSDRALALSEGALRGNVGVQLAPVVPLRQAAGA